jgi:hypothetical protein
VSKKAGIKGHLMGENLGVSGEKSGERLKMTVMWHRGALLSVRGKEKEGTGLEMNRWATVLFPLLGRRVPRGHFHILFFSSLSFFFFFCFLCLIITFAFDVQMTSNQLQKFSKIQRNKQGQ